MSTLLLMIALAQSDAGCASRIGSGMGLMSLKRINDALDSGACDQAQRELREVVRCDSSPTKSMEPFRSRIELCRSKAVDAGRP